MSKEINVIPSEVPIVFNMQSVNVDNANFEICEMDMNGYMNYLQKRYTKNFSPTCLQKYSTGVTLKNTYWKLSNNKFDLEKDIAQANFKSPFILVR